MTLVRVPLQRLPHGEELELPAYASVGSAGLDVRAAVENELIIAPGERALVPSGFALEIPAGLEAQVRPRSGLALRHGVTVLNSPGTIDSDFRGEVGLVLANLGREPFVVRRGDRIGQLVFAAVARVAWDEVDELAASRRGAGGFGSSGR